MPIFKYRAKKGPQEVIEGTIETRSKEETIAKLSEQGYFPISIEKVSIETDLSGTTPVSAVGRIKLREIINFSRQLSSLLKSGVPILKSLTTISEQTENSNFKMILNYLYTKIKAGEPFSSAIARYPQAFSPLYLAMVRAGESSGNLEKELLRISNHLKKENDFFSSVRTALLYPLFMAIVCAITVTFILVFTMPRLLKIFSDLGQELPLPTKIVLGISSGLREHWFWILLGLLIIGILVRRGIKVQSKVFSLMKLRLPILGNFFLKVELARFCRTLELLIKSGIPVLSAIRTAIPVLSNEIIKDGVRQAQKEVEQGNSFGKSLQKLKLFPRFVTNLTIVGEESGHFAESFAEIADFYERDTEEALKISTTILEPLMILIVGGVIGFIIIAMLLPIFQINLM